MKKMAILLLLLMVIPSLSACSFAGVTVTESENGSSEESQTEAVSTAISSEMFTDRDLEIGYDEETSTQITLSGGSASSDSGV